MPWKGLLATRSHVGGGRRRLQEPAYLPNHLVEGRRFACAIEIEPGGELWLLEGLCVAVCHSGVEPAFCSSNGLRILGRRQIVWQSPLATKGLGSSKEPRLVFADREYEANSAVGSARRCPFQKLGSQGRRTVIIRVEEDEDRAVIAHLPREELDSSFDLAFLDDAPSMRPQRRPDHELLLDPGPRRDPADEERGRLDLPMTLYDDPDVHPASFPSKSFNCAGCGMLCSEG